MSFSSTLRSWVPEHQPQKWIIINVVCCGWSFLLLLIDLFFTDDSLGKNLAKAQYLVYDLTTTTVWVVEIGLTAVFDHDMTSWQQWLEFLLAIYFLGDSAYVLFKFKLKQEHTSTMGVAVTIGFLSYLYKSISLRQELLRRQDFEERRGDNDCDDSSFQLRQDSSERAGLVPKFSSHD